LQRNLNCAILVLGKIREGIGMKNSIRVSRSKGVLSLQKYKNEKKKKLSKLTKPILLKLSKFAKLNKKQATDLEQHLCDREADIKKNIDFKSKKILDIAGKESMIKGDDAEVAEKQRLSNNLLQEIDSLKLRLEMVQGAITKLYTGNYGICEESEEPIGYERLCLVPWTRFGVSVQEKREKQLRSYGFNARRAQL